jgi:hypothetical protein
MHRIDGAGHVNGQFVHEDIDSNRPPTEITADWLNDYQGNLCRLVEAAGLVLSKGDYQQLLGALVKRGLQNAYFTSATGDGSADAITAAFSLPITDLADGMVLYVRATAANVTTAPTFTPAAGTIPAKAIVKGANKALAAGDIAGAGHRLQLQYDFATDKWILLNPAKGVNQITAIDWGDITNKPYGGIPVQQGTGIAQLNNAIKIGYRADGRLAATVDNTDLGPFIFGTPSDLSVNHATTAGYAGSAGDADTVDGYHADYLRGVGMGYADLAFNTTYTNSTSRTAFACCNVIGSGRIYVGGLVAASVNWGTTGIRGGLMAPVPPGQTFQMVQDGWGGDYCRIYW